MNLAVHMQSDLEGVGFFIADYWCAYDLPVHV